jgi:hypothetical protein
MVRAARRRDVLRISDAVFLIEAHCDNCRSLEAGSRLPGVVNSALAAGRGCRCAAVDTINPRL